MISECLVSPYQVTDFSIHAPMRGRTAVATPSRSSFGKLYYRLSLFNYSTVSMLFAREPKFSRRRN